MANGILMKVESIAECSPWSILQYFWPALKDIQNQFLVFFLSGRLRQVLLYTLYEVFSLKKVMILWTLYACHS